MMTPKFLVLVGATATVSSCSAFSPPTSTSAHHDHSLVTLSMKKGRDAEASNRPANHPSRAHFLASVALTTAAIGTPSPSYARGRATLELSYDRYTPRILAGGQFYSKDLKKMIEKNDWAAIKAATSDPPKKTKADRAKQDGGIAERAAQAGGFSDARVLVAADLFSAAFSDNSISPKTKAMKAEVEKMRAVVQGMNQAAKEALGEEKASGGLFGIGAKKPSQAELAKAVRQLYIDGGNAYNQYIYAANEDLPLQLAKMPYL